MGRIFAIFVDCNLLLAIFQIMNYCMKNNRKVREKGFSSNHLFIVLYMLCFAYLILIYVPAIPSQVNIYREINYSCITFSWTNQIHFSVQRWVEQDPMEILQSVYECIEKTCEKLGQLNIDISNIKGILIEYFILWHDYFNHIN